MISRNTYILIGGASCRAKFAPPRSERIQTFFWSIMTRSRKRTTLGPFGDTHASTLMASHGISEYDQGRKASRDAWAKPMPA